MYMLCLSDGNLVIDILFPWRSTISRAKVVDLTVLWKEKKNSEFWTQLNQKTVWLWMFYLHVHHYLLHVRARSHWAFAFAMSQMQMLKWVLYPMSNGVTNANAQCE